MSDVMPSAEQVEEDREGNPLSIASEVEHPRFRWTPKRRRFVIAYVRSNGEVGKSSLEAGYASTAEGSYLLSLQPIRQAIEKYLRAHLAATEVTEESVVERWANWADASPADFFEYQQIPVELAEGRQIVIDRLRLKNFDELTDKQRKALKKVTVRDTQHGQDIQIEVQDQAKANDRLAQVLGMLNTDSQLANVPPPEEAARMIHDFLQKADEADGLSGEQGAVHTGGTGGGTDTPVDAPDKSPRAA